MKLIIIYYINFIILFYNYKIPNYKELILIILLYLKKILLKYFINKKTY